MLNANVATPTTEQSHWLPRPNDLPDEVVLSREPRLWGIEHNAIFRAITANRRRWWKRKLYPTSGIYWIFVIALIYFTNIFGLLIFFLIRNVSFSRDQLIRRIERTTGMPLYLWNEAAVAGVSREDFTLGLWGSLVTVDRLRRERIGIASQATFAIAIYALFAFGFSFRFGVAGLCAGLLPMIVMALAVRNAAVLRASPFHALPRMQRLVESLEHDIMNQGRYFGLSFMILGKFIGIFSLLGFITLLLGAVAEIFRLESRLNHIDMATLELVFGIAVGYLWGNLRRKSIVDSKATYLNLTRLHLQAIERWIASQYQREVEPK